VNGALELRTFTVHLAHGVFYEAGGVASDARILESICLFAAQPHPQHSRQRALKEIRIGKPDPTNTNQARTGFLPGTPLDTRAIIGWSEQPVIAGGLELEASRSGSIASLARAASKPQPWPGPRRQHGPLRPCRVAVSPWSFDPGQWRPDPGAIRASAGLREEPMWVLDNPACKQPDAGRTVACGL